MVGEGKKMEVIRVVGLFFFSKIYVFFLNRRSQANDRSCATGHSVANVLRVPMNCSDTVERTLAKNGFNALNAIRNSCVAIIFRNTFERTQSKKIRYVTTTVCFIF